MQQPEAHSGPLRIVMATGERHYGLIADLLARRHQLLSVIVPSGDVLSEAPRHWRLRMERLLGRDLTPICRKHGVPIRVDRHLEDGSLKERLRRTKPDLLLVLGWPLRIPISTLDLFRLGGLNVHPSLLPQLRGPDPIFHALDQGLTRLGVTYHAMTQSLDCGGIVLQRPLTLMPKDTYDRAYLRVRSTIQRTLIAALTQFNMNPTGLPQVGPASKAIAFSKRHRTLDPTASALAMERRSRACNSHHAMFFSYRQQLYTFTRLQVEARVSQNGPEEGVIGRGGKHSMRVRIGQHWVSLKGIRPASNTQHPFNEGERIGSVEQTQQLADRPSNANHHS